MSGPAKPHVVVIEPHMDDAALSVGGRLLLRRGRARATILSVTKWSNYTRELMHRGAQVDVGEVTRRRCDEAGRAARLLGAEHRTMDEFDAPLRFLPPGAWSRDALARLLPAFKAWTAFGSSREDVSALALRMRDTILALDPDELWVPLGAGRNIDHWRTRDACLAMVARESRLAAVRVLLYEDVPYAYRYRQHAAQIVHALSSAGSILTRLTEDVTEVFDEKMQAISLFGSQLDAADDERALRGAARYASGDEHLAEAYYEVSALPRETPQTELSHKWKLLRKLRTRLSSWIESGRGWERVVLIALSPLGRWEEGMRLFLEAFPTASVTAFVPSRSAWETESFCHDRVRVRIVRPGLLPWLRVLLGQVASFGTPTAVASRWPAAIAAMLPLRRRIGSRFLGDVCVALREALDARSAAR